MAKSTFRVPDENERAVIATEAAKGSDAALAARDRRSRPRISARTHHAPGTTVYVGDLECVVLGPGRGEGWALLGWVEDDGARFYGTFHEDQITTVRPSAPDARPVTGGGRT